MSSPSTALRRPSLRLVLAGMLTIALALAVTATASARPAYYVVNKNSDKALMPAGGSTAWGVPIYQRTRQNVAAQRWFVNSEPQRVAQPRKPAVGPLHPPLQLVPCLRRIPAPSQLRHEQRRA